MPLAMVLAFTKGDNASRMDNTEQTAAAIPSLEFHQRVHNGIRQINANHCPHSITAIDNFHKALVGALHTANKATNKNKMEINKRMKVNKVIAY